ncbi:MAG TPA: class I SAM-dependent methyltransferase [Anaeromyxobacteraceae bacterium]|nr:class I SAM-dependent methyltransferase [Anaeromyxobacteraceae bacterium]
MRGVEQVPWLYDAMMAAQEWGGLGRWRRWLAGGARGRTLDLGCGTGRSLPLFPAGIRALGMDPSAESLRRARRRAPRVPLVRAGAEALPFKDGAFDTVVSGLVLCSVADPARALSEVRRVLAPGGALRMLEHVRSRSRFWGRMQDLVQPTWTWVAGGCHPNRETERGVEAAGFAIDLEGRRERGTMRRFQARVRPRD